jgi:glycerophosphoryl diester phosphodiesterase
MLIIAHRGYSSRYPENSVLAFEKAIDAGADYIETDLRFSLDGTIVCCHDPDLKRIAGRADAIENLKAQDLKNVSLLNGQSILSLQDVLEIAVRADHRVQVMFDVKVPTEAMLDTVLPLVEKKKMSADIMYGARTVDHAESLKKRASKFSILGMPKKTSLISAFIEAGVTAIRVWEEDITPEIVSTIKAAGLPVWITAGLRGQGEAAGDITCDRIEALDHLGADAVLVNNPALARQVIEGGNQNNQLAAGGSA